jgi:hypothetical protein
MKVVSISILLFCFVLSNASTNQDANFEFNNLAQKLTNYMQTKQLYKDDKLYKELENFKNSIHDIKMNINDIKSSITTTSYKLHNHVNEQTDDIKLTIGGVKRKLSEVTNDMGKLQLDLNNEIRKIMTNIIEPALNIKIKEKLSIDVPIIVENKMSTHVSKFLNENREMNEILRKHTTKLIDSFSQIVTTKLDDIMKNVSSHPMYNKIVTENIQFQTESHNKTLDIITDKFKTELNKKTNEFSSFQRSAKESYERQLANQNNEFKNKIDENKKLYTSELQKMSETLQKQNNKLQEHNNRLQEHNNKLQEQNSKLEEYIKYSKSEMNYMFRVITVMAIGTITALVVLYNKK